MKVKTKKVIGFIYNNLIKIGVSFSGVGSVVAGTLTGDISTVIAGAVAVSSAISAAVRDKKIAPLMKVVNVIACNIDRASNNPVKNKA